MPKSFRRVLFYFLLFLFILTTSLVFGYANGWSLDFRRLNWTRLGGIFIRSNPPDALITINGSPLKSGFGSLGIGAKNGIFSKGELVSGLIPAFYDLKVQKEGYRVWEKKLEVQPGLVSSVSKINLIPESPKEVFLDFDLDDFWMVGERVVARSKDRLFLIDDEGKKTFLRGSNVLRSDRFGRRIITASGRDVFLINLADAGSAFNLSGLFYSLKERILGLPGEVEIKESVFHPFLPDKFLFLTKKALYLLDVKKPDLQLIGASSSDRLKELGVLYPEAEKSVIAEDGKKQAFLNSRGSVGVLFLKDYNWDFRKKAGETEVIGKEGKIVITFDWWNKEADHLLLNYGDELILTEVDDRSERNQWVIGRNVKSFGQSRKGDKIYILNYAGVLKKLELD